jgi:hypothetical protein
MKEIKYPILYFVFVRTFVIIFYYGSGTVIKYGFGSDCLTSYGSGSGSGSTTLQISIKTPKPQMSAFLKN